MCRKKHRIPESRTGLGCKSTRKLIFLRFLLTSEVLNQGGDFLWTQIKTHVQRLPVICAPSVEMAIGKVCVLLFAFVTKL